MIQSNLTHCACLSSVLLVQRKCKTLDPVFPLGIWYFLWKLGMEGFLCIFETEALVCSSMCSIVYRMLCLSVLSVLWWRPYHLDANAFLQWFVLLLWIQLVDALVCDGNSSVSCLVVLVELKIKPKSNQSPLIIAAGL